MAGGIVWLDGPGASVGEVGARGAALAQLRAAGVCVPRGFALGRSLLDRFADQASRDSAAHIPTKLPPDVQSEIAVALPGLGGSYAIRRSPLEDAPPDTSWQVITQGGRPQRETYLHLTDGAEVSEAVRRIWGRTTAAPAVAILVQRFVAPDVCAIVRCDASSPDQLQVLSSLGIGDLLAAGLVVPDRHSIKRDTGAVVSSSLGRKAQMTVARPDGGVVRVPVPAAAARRMAIDDPRLADLSGLWRAAEEACGQMYSLAVAWSGGRWNVTTAVPAPVAQAEGLMLG